MADDGPKNAIDVEEDDLFALLSISRDHRNDDDDYVPESLRSLVEQAKRDRRNDDDEMMEFPPTLSGSSDAALDDTAVEEGDDYVPESLRSFVEQARHTLKHSRDGFLSLYPQDGEEEILQEYSMEEDTGEEGRLRRELLRQQQSAAFILSPELLRSPPPHPAMDLSDSEVKRAAFEDRLASPLPPYQLDVAKLRLEQYRPSSLEVETKPSDESEILQETLSPALPSGSQSTPFELIDVTSRSTEDVIDVTCVDEAAVDAEDDVEYVVEQGPPRTFGTPKTPRDPPGLEIDAPYEEQDEEKKESRSVSSRSDDGEQYEWGRDVVLPTDPDIPGGLPTGPDDMEDASPPKYKVINDNDDGCPMVNVQSGQQLAPSPNEDTAGSDNFIAKIASSPAPFKTPEVAGVVDQGVVPDASSLASVPPCPEETSPKPQKKSFFDRISDRLAARKSGHVGQPSPPSPQQSALEQMQESAEAALAASMNTGVTLEIDVSPLSGPSLDNRASPTKSAKSSRTIIEEQVSPLTEASIQPPSPSPTKATTGEVLDAVPASKETLPPVRENYVTDQNALPDTETIEASFEQKKEPDELVVERLTSGGEKKAPSTPGAFVRGVSMEKQHSDRDISSRLLLGTTSSQSRSAVPAPSRPKRGPTAASNRFSVPTASSQTSRAAPMDNTKSIQRRATSSHPTGNSSFMKATAASQIRSSRPRSGVSAEEARAKAQERVRQRLAQEQQKSDRERARDDPFRMPTISVKEGIGRAQKRVRRAQMKKRKGTEKENAGKANLRYRPTIPSSPKFATSARLSRRGLPKDEPTLAQSTSLLRNSLRDDRSQGTTATGPSRKPRLTVPKTPKFATTKRYGERSVTVSSKTTEVTLARSTDVLKQGLRGGSSVQSRIGLSRTSLTVPKTPHFKTTRMYGEKTPSTQGRHIEQSLACSSQVLQNNLRSADPKLLVKRGPRLTIPHPPRLHKVSTRQLPQSTEEKEKEMMEYYQSHPFKAHPIIQHYSHVQSTSQLSKRRMTTTPVPFQLRTAQHRSLHHAVSPLPTATVSELEDLEESKKQFHARPLPKFRAPRSLPRDETRKQATTPHPFHLSTSDRKTIDSLSPQMQPPEADFQPFKAKPLPKSTYKPTITPNALRSPGSHSANPSSPSLAPKLSTSERSPKRQAASEASRKRVESLALEREMKMKKRQEEALRKEILKAEESRTHIRSDLKPFTLQSTQRHDAYLQKLVEKRAQEEEEFRRQALFRARSFRSPPAPERIKSDRPTTTPEPFNLKSLSRHAAYEEEQRKKIEADGEETKNQAFKAKPLPKSTYKYTPPSMAHRNASSVSDRAIESGISGSPSLLVVSETEAADDETRNDVEETAGVDSGGDTGWSFPV